MKCQHCLALWRTRSSTSDILEFDVPSYRTDAAQQRSQSSGGELAKLIDAKSARMVDAGHSVSKTIVPEAGSTFSSPDYVDKLALSVDWV